MSDNISRPMVSLEPYLLESLACPSDKSGVKLVDDKLQCELGHIYVIEQGVPIFAAEPRRELLPSNMAACKIEEGLIDPFVNDWIVNTNGNLYWDVRGRLPRYPMPDWPLDQAAGEIFIELGCGWGRWCLAAAQAGFIPIGLDVHHDAVAAATRVAHQMGLKSAYACADIESLPIRSAVSDLVFSYSVLQHMDKIKVARVFKESWRILKSPGRIVFQLPNAVGTFSLARQIQRGFREARTNSFEMRYWSKQEILRVASDAGFVKVRIKPHSFFSQNPQLSDLDLLSPMGKLLVRASHAGVRAAERIPFLAMVADSIWVEAQKT